VSKDQGKYTIVQREKELYNTKCYYTIFESLSLASSSHTSKIVRIKNTVLDSIILDVMILILRVGYKNNSCFRETQENSIEIPLQTSLPFILLQIVCAHYCAPYPKWPCVEHEVNMWYPCCITSFVLESCTLFFQVSWPILWPYHQIVTDVTVWPITFDPNPNCSKNRKNKK